MGLYSCLEKIPGVKDEDVLGFKQRKRLGRKPDIARALIVDRRFYP